MPPCWTRTQLSGCLHYPTCGSEGELEHLQPQRDNGHMLQTAGVSRGPGIARASATDTLLRYFAPDIEWEFVGIDERWREGVRVVFRKRPDRNKGRRPEILDREAS
jgi:hypothetical protein